MNRERGARKASGTRLKGEPTRAPWGSISRAQVVDAALQVVRDGGFETMTIRSLAADLGVAPMSLYRHVRDKDDLLDEVVDRLLSRIWRPRCDSADWHAWVIEAADRLRRFLVTQPAALYVYLRHPVVTPAAIVRMEATMEVLNRAIGSEAAPRAYAVLHTYTVGFAALEASRAGWTPADETDALAQELAAYTTSPQFMEGLGYLIDGIERGAKES